MNKFIFGMLIILTTLLMGSSFAIGKIGLAYSSPLLLAAMRFTLAGIIMAVIIKMMKRPHPKTKEEWMQIIVIGFFQTTGVMGCIFMSLRTITAGESSILTFINPLLVVVFGTMFLKTKYDFIQWFGVIIGFLGVYITMGANLEFRIGTLFGFLSAIFWAISTIMTKRWVQKIDTWVLSSYQMLFGGLFLMIGSIYLETPFFIFNVNSFFNLLWLIIMSSIVQFAMWFYLLQKGEPGRTSSFLFLAPFFGVVSGWLLLGEILRWSIIIGGLLIIVGIYLVNSKGKNIQIRKLFNLYKVKSTNALYSRLMTRQQ